jgi:UDP-N-acetylglucosamine 2-epimerase (non-hydrolysing)
LVKILNSIAEKYNLPIIVSTHPRTFKRINQEKITFNSLITLLKPLGFFDYVFLQKNAKVVLSDSGTISEETSILDFPSINIRDAHERPEAMEEAVVMMTGMNQERILQCISLLDQEFINKSNKLPISVKDYSMPNVSEKVVKIILSYTDYINKKIWKNY